MKEKPDTHEWQVINWPKSEWEGDFCLAIYCPFCQNKASIIVDAEDTRKCQVCNTEFKLETHILARKGLQK
jgi:ribosomal protein S27E